MKITRCETLKQAADLFTKPFTKPDAWERVISLVGLRRLNRQWWAQRPSSGGSPKLLTPGSGVSRDPATASSPSYAGPLDAAPPYPPGAGGNLSILASSSVLSAGLEPGSSGSRAERTRGRVLGLVARHKMPGPERPNLGVAVDSDLSGVASEPSDLSYSSSAAPSAAG